MGKKPIRDSMYTWRCGEEIPCKRRFTSEGSEIVQETRVLTLDALPLPDLDHITRLIPFKDRLILQQVCHRFNREMSYADLTSFSTDDMFAKSTVTYLSPEKLQNILKLVARYLGPKLKELTILRAQVSKKWLKYVGENFPKLETFILAYSKIDRSSDLRTIPDVKNLILEGISFTCNSRRVSRDLSECLASKINLINLKFSISYLQEILISNKFLSTVSCSNLSGFSDKDLLFLCLKCPNIQNLDIGATRVQDLTPIASLPNLNLLNISQLKIQLESLHAVSSKCACLKELYMVNTLAPQGDVTLEKFPALEILNAWGSAMINDRTLLQLAGSQSLRKICLAFTAVTVDGILALADRSPKLEELVIFRGEIGGFPQFLSKLFGILKCLKVFGFYQKILLDTTIRVVQNAAKSYAARLKKVIPLCRWGNFHHVNSDVVAFPLPRMDIASWREFFPLIIAFDVVDNFDFVLKEILDLKDEQRKSALVKLRRIY